jgi:hypothetical protein
MLNDLLKLRDRLICADSLLERISILDLYPPVRKILSLHPFFRSFVERADPESGYVLKQLVATGQLGDFHIESEGKWKSLLGSLLSVDHFYREIGGIVGYQVEVLKLLRDRDEVVDVTAKFHAPQFDDISVEDEGVKESIRVGLESMPFMAELYPLGGAADRLHLIDEETGLELPAAKLPFAGRSLVEIMIRDVQAREWLYYRLYGKQITTPIAVMSSWEKNNCLHVTKVFESHHWFGRPAELFHFFVQPLVPAFDEQGNWHQAGPLNPILKPGGHGAIWKLARDEGVFSWLKGLGCTKALVRQINNPIAGLDYGLIAFSGVGCSRNMSFGFTSCNRLVKASEGVVVLVEKPAGAIVLTNIEYCDFGKFGIQDEPLHPGLPFSRYRSNTNILFADLDAVEKAVTVDPFPGLLMNLKPTTIVDEAGCSRETLVARLESTMQNIADGMVELHSRSTPLKTNKTFVVHNERHKTISVAKKVYQPGKPLSETPELCFYELLVANRELLLTCGIAIPRLRSPEEYLEKGPSVHFVYHPALGPLYSIISQKLRGGHVSLGSELILDLAEIDVENLELDGSLRICAAQPIGSYTDGGILRYNSHVGRAILQNVTVENQGVDWSVGSPFWKMNLQRKETVQIDLQGWSEFDARNVHLKGSHHFVVENGVRMVVRQGKSGLVISKTAIEARMLWTYSWENGVKLTSNLPIISENSRLQDEIERILAEKQTV